MQRFVLAKRAWLLFLVLAAIAYLYGLGNFPFVGPDEPRYAQVAREMFERGDLITPTLGGHTWFEKPALPYWAIVACYELFGVSEWAARLGFALMGLLTVIVIYFVARRAESFARVGEGLEYLATSCAVVASSSAGFLLFSHGVNFDIPLTLMTTIALGSLFLAELEEERRNVRLLWLAGFYAGAGASLLAKGLIGFIITFGVAASYYIVRRAWPARDVMLSLLWGVPLAFLVASVWYAPVIARHGRAFVDEFFIQHHFARYTSNKYHHPQPFYFYIPVLLMMALPWTPYLIEALAGARKWQWRAPGALNKWRAFALCWMLVPVLFFSASGSKLPGYILPALPGAVMLVAERLARMLKGEGGLLSMRASGLLLSLLAIALLVYVRHEGLPVMACAVASASLLIAAGLATLFMTKKGWIAAGAIVCGLFLTVILSLECGVSGVSSRISTAYALEQARRRGYGNAPVYQLHTIERTAEYYAAGRLQYGADGEPVRFEGVKQIEAAAREKRGAVLVIVPSEYSGQVTTYAPLQSEVIDDNKEVALIAVRIRE